MIVHPPVCYQETRRESKMVVVTHFHVPDYLFLIIELAPITAPYVLSSSITDFDELTIQLILSFICLYHLFTGGG